MKPLNAEKEPLMSAEIHNIRDYQSKRAIERAHKELEKEAAKILTPFVETVGFTETIPVSEQGIPCVDRFNRAMGIPENIPYGGAGIDGLWKDPS